ncbi:M protein repeat protein [Aspergillus candidus]|uniref:TATA element modulatory factor 1 TATA binding-domain-containing protein n=1 Tax=Aspergillus candidus TaxID=41067 RepID=A0A2I2FA01_ASPCN|nr:TATA element modulatory factor 1 TATA binding-domain-containing protein [Aspergillus candidus]PLB37457.1 TATA element modulatory factor 1 TATA binding-domain-containing protein [Aspergillus candidus]
MAQTPQQKWKVGSFFQQAVAGVESKLDLILAEEEDRKQLEQLQAKSNPAQANQTGNLSRSSSNARKNDRQNRLQERLARAVVGSNSGPNASTSSSPSRPASPVTGSIASNDARSSMDAEFRVTSPLANAVDVADAPTTAVPRASYDSGASPRNSKDIGASSTDNATGQEGGSELPVRSASAANRPSDDTGARPSNELARSAAGSPAELDQDDTTQLRTENDEAESERQQEIYGYIERIDALQSKLKYLAKEAAESAKKAAATAEPGSVEKQLREKDEKIALLLEEGQKLSKSEMDHRSALRKLRSQFSENSKAQVETKKKMDRLELDVANAEARAKRAEAAEKRANETVASQAKTTRDLEAAVNERNALTQTVQEMKAQLARATARAESAESKAQSDALEKEKRRVSQLEEDLSNTKSERDASEEALRREIDNLKEKGEQERERTRMLEAESKNEQAVLESKLESLRSRAEEASSGVAGDAQAKLLRQVETLQTQYAVASENWQTLEGSLLARLASVEKERDEAARREGEMRRKVREANLKVKRVEEELDNAKDTEHDLESKLEERAQELQKLEQRLQKAQHELESAQKDFVEQKKVSDAIWAQKLEEEQAKWRDLAMPAPSFLKQSRNASPVAFNRRPSTLEAAAPLSDSRPLSRRSSNLPMSPEIGTPPRQNSFPLSTQASLSPVINSAPTANMAEPSAMAFDSDEFFTGSGSPSAFGGAPTQHSRGINDLISESTVGAGPSVQLVERMSATVRRLESERAASKDELARITSQRDEARQQVVDLMRESDEKKASDARIQELQKDIAALDERYQTTLEMLGEKSEQVEELQADVADLKRIYRELADSTMK